MSSPNVVQLRRCPACGHLIPKDSRTCPYCSNVEIKRPTAQREVQRAPATPQAPQSVVQNSQLEAQAPQQEVQASPQEARNSQFEQPVAPSPTTPHANKGLRGGIFIGASFILAAIIGVLVWNLLFDAQVLKQSILKPLTQEQLEAQSKSYPQLIKYADLFSDIRKRVIGTPDEATYQSITYEQMIDYLDFLASDAEQEKLRNKALSAYADYRKPYEEKFQAEADRWTKFYNEHDPSAYLKLTFHTRYEKDESDPDYIVYHPAFWVDISYPKGAIKDCEVFFGLYYDLPGFKLWHYRGTATLSLEGLKACTQSAGYYFPLVPCSDQDFYDECSIRYEVRSVTLQDGTTISLSERDKIPREILEYIEEQTPENKDLAISAVVDANFLEQDEYVNSYIEKYREKKDELCYDLLSKIYGYTMIPSLEQN